MDLFRAACSYNNPQHINTPENYVNKLLLCIDNEYKYSIMNCNPPFDLKDKESVQSKVFIGISSLSSIFSYLSDLNGDDSKSNDATSRCSINSTEICDIDLKPCVASNEISMKAWYQQALKDLQLKKVHSFLVPMLIQNCLYIRHLVSKTLILGIQKNFFEVSDILTCLCTLLDNCSLKVEAIIEFLIVLLTSKCVELSKVKLPVFLAIVNQSNKPCSLFDKVVSMVSTAKNHQIIFNILHLHSCVFKLGNLTDHNIIIRDFYSEFDSRLEFLMNHVCQLSRGNLGHLLCTRLFKVIKSMLSWQGQGKKCHTAIRVLTLLPDCVVHMEKNNLMCSTDFVGETHTTAHSTLNRVRSTLSQTLTLVVLKASLIIMNEEQKDRDAVIKAMTSAMQALSDAVFREVTAGKYQNHVTNGSTLTLDKAVRSGMSMINDITFQWLTLMFGDQDNHWVDALSYQITLWKLVNKMHKTEDSQMPPNRTPSLSVATLTTLPQSPVAPVTTMQPSPVSPVMTSPHLSVKQEMKVALAKIKPSPPGATVSPQQVTIPPSQIVTTNQLPPLGAAVVIPSSTTPEAPKASLLSAPMAPGVTQLPSTSTVAPAASLLASVVTSLPSAPVAPALPGLLRVSPYELFLQFSAFIKHDHLVCADLLASPETHFLSYLTSLLRLVSSNWSGFVAACSTHNQLCSDLSASVTNDLINYRSIKYEQSQMCASNSLLKSPEINNCVNNNCVENKEELEVTHNIESISQNVLEAEVDEGVMKGDDVFSNLLFKRKVSPSYYTNNQSKILKTEGLKVTSPWLVQYSDSEDGSDDTALKHDSSGTEVTEIDKNDYELDQNDSVNSSEDSAFCKQLDIDTEVFNLDTEVKIDTHLDTVMAMLIRLRLHLERLQRNDLFPYNIMPITYLLSQCEDLYEI